MFKIIWSYIRWFLVMLLYSFFFGSLTGFLLIFKIIIPEIPWWIIIVSPVITQYVAFALLWPFRYFITQTKWLPFYFYFDSELDNFYGDPEWIEERNKKKNFFTAWEWHTRNMAWNFWLYFSATRINPEIIKFKGEVHQYDDMRDVLFYPCQIKTTKDNYGEIFDPSKSKLGWLFIMYKDNDKIFWNFSKAYKVKDFDENKAKYREIEIGYNDKRYLLNVITKTLKNG